MADLRIFFQGLTPTVDAPLYYFPRTTGGTWICTDYSTSKNDNEGSLLKGALGLSGWQWQWHHVVETNHLRPLFDPMQLEIIKYQFTPCFLISQKEHSYFSTNFHSGVYPWLTFGLTQPTHSVLYNGQQRINYVDKLRHMYDEVYTGADFESLKIISHNFLDSCK